MDATKNSTSTCWTFRIAGYFWIFVGLAGSVLFLIGHREDLFESDRILYTLLLLIGCCVLVYFGYGLSKAKLWSKISGAVLAPLMALYFLDMAAMCAFNGFNGHLIFFWLFLFGVLMSGYTLAVILFVRK